MDSDAALGLELAEPTVDQAAGVGEPDGDGEPTAGTDPAQDADDGTPTVRPQAPGGAELLDGETARVPAMQSKPRRPAAGPAPRPERGPPPKAGTAGWVTAAIVVLFGFQFVQLLLIGAVWWSLRGTDRVATGPGAAAAAASAAVAQPDTPPEGAPDQAPDADALVADALAHQAGEGTETPEAPDEAEAAAPEAALPEAAAPEDSHAAAAVASTTTATTRTASSSKKRRAAEPEPEPEEVQAEPTGQGSVIIRGSKGYLVGSAGRISTGQVPTGDYEVFAILDGGGSSSLGTVTVADGATVVFKCGFGTCKRTQ